MSFGQKLSLLCRIRGWSAQDLADEVGEVSKQTALRWMNGRTWPRLDEAVRIADLFRVPLDYLARNEIAVLSEADSQRVMAEGLRLSPVAESPALPALNPLMAQPTAPQTGRRLPKIRKGTGKTGTG